MIFNLKVGYWYLSFILIIVCDKSNLALIVKKSSSTLMWIASTASIPLASIAFTSSLIMGKSVAKLSSYTIAGLVLVIIGLVIYRSRAERNLKNAINK